eukprot:CAMPEP_0198316494 /NCGR_PEP_ID=MMETSP1450-20131203/6366_1 /TAXON_ID=753684 ORGANISM="Madagascaria erythrocladiodes, Strain CCMP3234" /NCGR_SAMPLE_ID=MMETSP1450 /ASSEMBLY_ACC=CAM_ASM_001115 /LENGTH=140 /DNA_ID=CAMNT_0044019653 /DNA_START=147 /DNA_END=569 /DNA_ORIENTATION=+
MASGVKVADECVSTFNELKLGHKYKFVIYKIDMGQESVVVEEAATEGDYDTFKSKLPADDCRYAVYDFEYDTDGGKRQSILFVLWSPDTAKIKAKMIYTSTKAEIRKALVGIGTEVQATDAAEVDWDTVLDKVTRGGTKA